MQNNAFLPSGEKYIKNKVELLSWSPTKDLLAISSHAGELLLYRLVGLERVWVLSPPEEGVKINSIKWRPDGKVIAVSYNNPKYGIHFVYMERAKIIWKVKAKEESCHIFSWQQLNKDKKDDLSKEKLTSELDSLTIKDYIPELPKLTSENDLSGQDIDTIIGDCGFHMLVVRSGKSKLKLLAYGLFPVLEIDCTSNNPGSSNEKLLNACVSHDFRYIAAITLITENGEMNCFSSAYQIDLLANNIKICDIVARKVAHMEFTLLYLSEVLECMKESCETALQETESKLTNFFKKKTEREPMSIGDDFMQLLMWGKASDTIKDLFGNRMTKKGIIKIGNSTESAYTKIQQYIILNLQIAMNSLYYHLAEIKGIISDPKSASVLPFKMDDVKQLMKTAGAFMLKGNEMLQVIDRSLQNFKAFFRWLYISMLKYQEEPVTPAAKMSQRDFAFVADFVYEHFTEDHEALNISSTGQENHFNVERVFQYLENEPLKCCMDTSGNDWYKFVDTSPCLASCDFILTRKPEASLRQLLEEIKTSLQSMCHSDEFPLSSTCERISHERSFYSTDTFDPPTKMWFHSSGTTDPNNDSKILFCSMISHCDFPSDKVLFQCCKIADSNESKNSDVCVKLINLNFVSENGGEETIHRKLSALEYYNDKLITILLSEPSQSETNNIWLAQVSLEPILKAVDDKGISYKAIQDTKTFNSYVPTQEAFNFIGHRRLMDARLKASKISTSGSREVVSVLSGDRHYISAFEMDQREDESESSEEEEME